MDALDEIEGLSGEIDKLKESLETIQTTLNDSEGVTKDDINAINTDLEKVKEDLAKLLEEKVANIDGPINIRNQAELTYVKSLGEFTSIKGNFTVDLKTDKTLIDSIAAINKITGRMTSIISGDLTTTGHTSAVLDFSALTFVDGSLSVNEKANNFDALTTVSKDLTLNYKGDYAFSELSSTGSITITDYKEVTKVDFPKLVTGASGATFQTAGDANSEVSLDKATHVNLGAVEVRTLTAPEAETVKLGYMGTLNGDTTIDAEDATSIEIGATKIGTHSLTITAKDDGKVSLNGLTEAGQGITITGGSLEAGKLKTVTGTITINKAKSISLPALEKVSGQITAPDANSFTAEKFIVSDVLELAGAEEVTIASAATASLTAADLEKLTLKALADGVTLDVSGFADLETIDITGKAAKTVSQGAQDNGITTGGGAAALKTVTLGGAIGTVSLTSNDDLETITTSGNIVNITVHENKSLKTIKFGHSFLKGELASTIGVTSNTALEELDMTAVQKVKTITITNNGKLTSIKVGAPDVLAEPVAAISYTVNNNKLPGKYTDAKAGSETEEYTPQSIVQADLYAIKLLINAYNKQKSRTASATFDLSFDNALDKDGKDTDVALTAKLDADTAAQNGEDGTAGNDDDDSNNATVAGSGIDTARELATLKKE